jgi:hypothetical protein
MSSLAAKPPTAALDRDNPFPGLRPYEEVDAEWFFGRGREINELLKRLRRVRFLAVVGPSGCGKSSLIKAGVLPGVRDGYLDAQWNIAVLRPAGRPLENLAEAISFTQSSDPGQLRKALDSGPLSLVEAIVRQGLSEETKVLILVDQFEELFQYVQRHGDPAQEEAKQFLKLLLTAAASDAAPIYIVITMRMEWLAECATYMGLAEAINEGIYLVPQPSRRQFQQAIFGPIEAAGGSITSALLDRMLNDLDGRTDQLPVLQHALMRVWQRRGNGAALDIPTYEAVGTFSDCLSNHAEEIFSELSSPEKQAAELLFRSITQVYKGRKMRRPRPLGEIAEVTGAAIEQLRAAAQPFHKQGRSFLVATPEDLSRESIIDISHEALIRQWERLRKWVDAEAEVQSKLGRLEEVAAEWDQGSRRENSALYRGAFLKQAEELRPRIKPDGAAAAFLRASRRAEFWGQMRSRGLIALIGVLVLFTLVSLAVIGKQDADAASTRARSAQQEADSQRQIAALAQQQAVKDAQYREFLKRLAVKGQSSDPSIARSLQARRIYLQYTGGPVLSLAQRLQAYLTSQGYSVPGIEQVSPNKAPRVTQVRYFNQDDLPAAQQIVALLKTILSAAPIPQRTANPNNLVPAGQLEVWLPVGATGCMAQYVRRDAGPDDFVCVTPEVRAHVQEDNVKASGRRAGDGAYGPDTCVPGYVWREAFANDHVCVEAAVRSQAANDNKVAASRILPAP